LINAGRFNMTMVSIEAKVVTLYISALAGASLAEIEVCRVGLWGCEPIRGAWIVVGGAAPMLIILIFTPMSKRLLVFTNLAVGLTMLLLGIRSAHSEGSLTWPGHHLTLLLFGTGGAAAIMAWFSPNQKEAALPPASLNLVEPNIPSPIPRMLSLKEKILYLSTGALAGGILGVFLIRGSENNRSTWNHYVISTSDLPLLLISIVGGSAPPVVILLSQLKMYRVGAILLSSIIAFFVLGLSLTYGEFDSLFGHYRLGYFGLWCAGILAALIALILQKRVLRTAG
jgi:hypothetical protein